MEDEQPRSTAELQEQLQEYRAQREAVRVFVCAARAPTTHRARADLAAAAVDR
jgi:hypothetical protein